MISTHSVTVIFGSTVALDNIDLTLSGGLVGLFGPNGSGKSTLLRTFAGLLRPDQGSVDFDGAEVSLSSESFRRRVGYAGHSSGLYPVLSVRENLELFAALYGAESAVSSTIESLALREVADTRVGTLSAGFARRVAVARAIVHDPDLLLLDEPYANLDDDAATIVSAAITAWARPGKQGVIATHGAKRVRAFADSGIVLQRGRLVSHRVSFAREPV